MPLLRKDGRHWLVDEAAFERYKADVELCLAEAGTDKDSLLAAPERAWRRQVHNPPTVICLVICCASHCTDCSAAFDRTSGYGLISCRSWMLAMFFSSVSGLRCPLQREPGWAERCCAQC